MSRITTESRIVWTLHVHVRLASKCDAMYRCSPDNRGCDKDGSERPVHLRLTCHTPVKNIVLYARRQHAIGPDDGRQYEESDVDFLPSVSEGTVVNAEETSLRIALCAHRTGRRICPRSIL